MNLLIYIFVYPLIWLISILPFRILYIFSDFLYYVVYYVVGYRNEAVTENLRLTFPNKSNKELTKVKKDFYHHFVDVFLEMIKSFSISKKEITKRYAYKNIELIDELYKDGKSVILVGSHYANWEWILSIGSLIHYETYAAYKKVRNTYLNNMVLKSRERFGVTLKPTSKIISQIKYNHKNNIQSIYGLLSDQSPQLRKTFYWRKFFGIKVPIHTGAEMLARKYNMNMVFMDVKKIKRGYYETTFSLITNEVSNFSNYELTDIFIDKVEKQVYKKPEYYFWTHKRFKHRNKQEKSKTIIK